MYSSYNYGPSVFEQLVLALLPWLPIVGVWIGGVVLALVLLPLSQRASAFAIAGLSLLGLELVFGMMGQFVLTRLIGMSMGVTEMYTLAFGALALARASVRALGIALLFAAVLQGRLSWPEAAT